LEYLLLSHYLRLPQEQWMADPLANFDMEKGLKETKHTKAKNVTKKDEQVDTGIPGELVQCGMCVVVTLEQVAFISGFILGCVSIWAGIYPV
jgi:hypothetical protein